MKLFILVLMAMLSISTHAMDDCKEVNPKVIAQLTDFMTVEQVDAAVGCYGVKTEPTFEGGGVWYSKAYNDFGGEMLTNAKKIKNHVIIAVFRDDKLMVASGTITPKIVITKYHGLPLKKCINGVCKPA